MNSPQIFLDAADTSTQNLKERIRKLEPCLKSEYNCMCLTCKVQYVEIYLWMKELLDARIELERKDCDVSIGKDSLE